MTQLSPEEERTNLRAMRIVQELIWVQRYVAVFGICILLALFLLIGEVYVLARQPVLVPYPVYQAYPAPKAQP